MHLWACIPAVHLKSAMSSPGKWAQLLVATGRLIASVRLTRIHVALHLEQQCWCSEEGHLASQAEKHGSEQSAAEGRWLPGAQHELLIVVHHEG